MNRKQDYIFILNILLVVLMAACFTVTWYRFYSEDIVFPFYRKGNWLVVALYIFIYVLVARQFSAFSIGNLPKSDLVYTQLIAIAIANLFIYCTISLLGRYWLPSYGVWLMTAVEFFIAIAWTIFSSRIFRKLHPPLSAILLHSDQYDETLVREIGRHLHTVNICKTVDASRVEDLKDIIDGFEIVLLDCRDPERRSEILNLCYELGKRVYISPDVTDILINGAQTLTAADRPLLMLYGIGLSAEQRFVKRLVDILLSAFGLALASPLLLIFAILIKNEDKGPVIYRQERLTRNGKPFTLYKFRTMSTDAEGDGVARLSSKLDHRITKIGNWLRRYRLDELPQFLNILKGDISIVGPRPERPELIREYKKTLPKFDFRLKVKGGLTGYAQVYGKYSTLPEHKLLLDLIYIENFSYLLDIRIFMMTIKSVFKSGSVE
jgi:exopolysaccharide biosynthesis polyprenyl glycosylphosphotransferase